MKDCAEQAERLLKQHKATQRDIDPTTSILDWDNHYSPKYRRCYLRESMLSHRTGAEARDLPAFTSEVYDAFEGRLLAMCTGQTAVKTAKVFCRVLDEGSSDGDCIACQRYIDEHMDR